MRARGSRKLSWNGLAPSFQLLYVSDEGRCCHEASLGPYSFCLFNVKWRKISKVHAWVALVLCVISSHVVEFKGVSHLILSLSADTKMKLAGNFDLCTFCESSLESLIMQWRLKPFSYCLCVVGLLNLQSRRITMYVELRCYNFIYYYYFFYHICCDSYYLRTSSILVDHK